MGKNGQKSSVSVSLLGNEAYRDALSIVAKRNGKPIGMLVREALDAKYGAEIRKELGDDIDAEGSFFALVVE